MPSIYSVMTRNIFGYVLAFFVSHAALAAPGPLPTLPLKISKESWRPLRECASPALEKELRTRLLASSTRKSLLGRDLMGVALVDLMDPDNPRFAEVNGDRMMYAASLPKVGILFAAAGALDDGSLKNSPALQKDMGRMIRVSSNQAASAMIDRLGAGVAGYTKINNTLRNSRFKLYDPREGGGLWVGKRFAKRGGRVGDPLRNISHAASATQVARLYYLAATGKAFSENASKEMLKHLADPGLNHYFVGTLKKRAPKARLYRKSGSWSRWRSDSILVWGPKRRYILVGIMEAGDAGKQILKDLVPIAENALAWSRVPAAVN